MTSKNDEKSFMKLVRLLMIILAVAQASCAVNARNDSDRVNSIQSQVEAIALAPGVEGRREAIIDRIERMGLDALVTWFDPPASSGINRQGANVTAELPGNAPTYILLGAHYDYYESAQGVIDNASGVAVVLDLAEAFLARPAQNFRIGIAFFDLEEDGLLGSQAMVTDSLNIPLPDIFLNFDIFGYGEGFWIGAEEPGGILPQLIRELGEADNLDVVVDSMYPGSDHLSFRQTRTDSYGISLLDAADIHILLELLSTGRGTGEIPRLFRIIHTEEDTIDKLNAEEVVRGIKVIEQALREFDSRPGKLN